MNIFVRHTALNGKYPRGQRTELKNGVLYSNWGNGIWGMLALLKGEANDEFSAQVEADLAQAEKVYIYFGRGSPDCPIMMVEALKARSKTVVLAGCTCNREWKEAYAKSEGIECILHSQCGGDSLIDSLIAT